MSINEISCCVSNSAARKELKYMSLVALYNTPDGIVCLSDSKSTKMYPDGRMEEDKIRGNIKKIFKNNKFIFVTCGLNELLVNNRIVNIEDWVQDNLTNDIDPENFFAKMREVVFKEPVDFDYPYLFCYGTKDKDSGYYFSQIEFNPQKKVVRYGEKNYRFQCFYGGNKWYQEIMSQYTFYTYFSPLKEIAEQKKKELEKLIELYDISHYYNPVGGPIRTEIFTLDED